MRVSDCYPFIVLTKSAHGTVDAILYNIDDDEMINWFSMIDVCGSKGWDKYNDSGIYFEIPRSFYEVVPDIPFVQNNHIVVEYPFE